MEVVDAVAVVEHAVLCILGPAVPGPASSKILHDGQKEIATLRLRLSPLVAAETTLGDRLSGGIRVAGSALSTVLHTSDTKSSVR